MTQRKMPALKLIAPAVLALAAPLAFAQSLGVGGNAGAAVQAGPVNAGVQTQARLDARDLLLGMDVDGHAAAVVADLAAAVGVQRHLDLAGVSGQRFVDRVVDHLLRQVVRARGIGVHAGAALDRIQAGKDFDVGGVVATAHSWGFGRRLADDE